jgi:hypothetical protein
MQQEKYDKLVYSKFPTAMNARDTSIHFMGLLKQKHHFNISRVLMATSMCSDEINQHDKTLFKVLNEPFEMGGLGGVPFVGITGMTAFAHHIPDGGAAFIVYGAHIGITDSGELGCVCRSGQDKKGNSCGALMHALTRLTGENYKPASTEDDYQQYYLEKTLLPFRDQIIHSDDPKLTITYLLYDHIHDLIKKYIHKTKAEFNIDRMALLGGIIINTEPGVDDYFLPKNFEIIKMNGYKK